MNYRLVFSKFDKKEIIRKEDLKILRVIGKGSLGEVFLLYY